MQRQSLLIGWSKQFTIAKFFDACMKKLFSKRASKIFIARAFRLFLEIIQ
jgi:hypothetical protein